MTLDELIKKAVQVIQENLGINEVELSDVCGRVRLVRNTPTIWYYQSPWVTHFQFPPI